MHSSNRFGFITLGFFALICIGTSVRAQTDSIPSVEEKIERQKSETLFALADNQADLVQRIDSLQTALKNAAAGAEMEQVQRQLAESKQRLIDLEKDINSLAAGVTLEEYFGNPADEVNLSLQEELGRLLAPMVSEVRKLSKKPRVIQELHTDLLLHEHRVEQAGAAVTNLQVQQAALAATQDPRRSSLLKLLKIQEDDWQARLNESRSRVWTIERRIAELRAADPGIWSTITDGLRHFVFTRGRNILLAALAFVVVFFGMRLLYLYGLKVIPLARLDRMGFFRRLLGLLNQTLSAVFGLIAALAVLYASGDWLLGGIAVLLVLVLALMAKNGVTRYFDQVRMLLNLGPAREGERVVIKGVPWQVGPVNFFTRLTNPQVGGPGLRVSLEQLMNMTSRPVVEGESWFPCRLGDVILMDGNLLATVRSIGPDFVTIGYQGGVTKDIPTEDFVQCQSANLTGGFMLLVTLGLDYIHQAEITQEIPRHLENDLRTGVMECLTNQELLQIQVDFKEASTSSLDLLVIARFDGSAALRYFELGRIIRRIAVESCTRHGWTIPFPQLMVHQASGK